MRPATVTLAALVAAIALAFAAGPAHAVVPPRDCGMQTVKGKRYNIKADQIRCRTARSYSRTYLTSHRRPRGYRCRDYTRRTKIKFRCQRGIRVFFAIRR
jgi:hypothetical protein